MTATVNYAVSDPERQLTGWELTISNDGVASHWCCFTDPNVSVRFAQAGVYRVGVDAIDAELQRTGNRQTAIVWVGGATGTPPVADITVDKLSGPVPLTVTARSQSYDPGGNRLSAAIMGDCQGSETATCTFDTPGVYSIIALAKNGSGLQDWVWETVVAYPEPSTPSPDPSPSPDPPAVAPVVAIATPVDGATVTRRSTLTVMAEATAGSAAVSRVDMFADAKLICSSTTEPYQCVWTVP
jgi:PKD repeat protein